MGVQTVHKATNLAQVRRLFVQHKNALLANIRQKRLLRLQQQTVALIVVQANGQIQDLKLVALIRNALQASTRLYQPLLLIQTVAQTVN